MHAGRDTEGPLVVVGGGCPEGAVDLDEACRQASPHPPELDPVGPGALAELLYTSGTTAAPKGVMVTHANLVFAGHYGVWETGLRSDDRLFTPMPACHSNFQLAALMPVVVAGACLVLAEALHAMGWLLLGTLIAGVATGLGYRFGLQRVNELSPDDRRAEVISSYLIVCYVGISLPVIGIGLVSSATSSLFADVLFGALIVALAFAALGYELWPSHRRQPAEA